MPIEQSQEEGVLSSPLAIGHCTSALPGKPPIWVALSANCHMRIQNLKMYLMSCRAFSWQRLLSWLCWTMITPCQSKKQMEHRIQASFSSFCPLFWELFSRHFKARLQETSWQVGCFCHAATGWEHMNFLFRAMSFPI